MGHTHLRAFRVRPLTQRDLVSAMIKFRKDDRPVGTIQYQSMRLLKCFRCGEVLEVRHCCPALTCDVCWGVGHQRCDEKGGERCALCGRGNHEEKECLGRGELLEYPETMRCVRCRQPGHFDCAPKD
jgi:hypothetical protein